jgi:Arc/MetJ-type ribon-helix-helix transcriptional regulator
MPNINVQVRLSPEIADQINSLAVKSKSEFLREAIREKIKKEWDKRLVEKWIIALQKKSDKDRYAIEWLKAESWGEP